MFIGISDDVISYICSSYVLLPYLNKKIYEYTVNASDIYRNEKEKWIYSIKKEFIEFCIKNKIRLFDNKQFKDIIKSIIPLYPKIIIDIDIKVLSKNMVKIAIDNGFSYDINPIILDKLEDEYIMKYISGYPSGVKCLSIDRQTLDMWKLAISKDCLVLLSLPDRFFDKELYDDTISNNPKLLSSCKMIYKGESWKDAYTSQISKINTLKSNIKIYLGYHEIPKDIIIKSLIKDPSYIEEFGIWYTYREKDENKKLRYYLIENEDYIFEQSILNCGSNICKLPYNKLSIKKIKKILKYQNKICIINDIPNDFRVFIKYSEAKYLDSELCTLLISNFPTMISYLPKQCITSSLIKLFIKNLPNNLYTFQIKDLLESIPKEHYTKNIILLLFDKLSKISFKYGEKIDIKTIKMIIGDTMFDELVPYLIKCTPHAISNIKSKYITKSIQDFHILKYPLHIQQIFKDISHIDKERCIRINPLSCISFGDIYIKNFLNTYITP